MTEQQFQELHKYTACDISDALLKLNVPGAGFLANITPLQPSGPDLKSDPESTTSTLAPTPTKVIARASTVLFVARSTPSFPTSGGSGGALSILNQTISQPLPNIPDGSPYSDLLTTPDTIVVLSQPPGQKCAVMGGIMAVRMRKLGAKAVLVDGRVRDLETLRELGVPVWSKGTSIIGAGAETKAWATNVPISVDSTVVEPGDVVMLDPTELGSVCIPAKLVDKVLELLPRLVSADEKVMKDVETGMTVGEAFKLHRGK